MLVFTTKIIIYKSALVPTSSNLNKFFITTLFQLILEYISFLISICFPFQLKSQKASIVTPIENAQSHSAKDLHGKEENKYFLILILFVSTGVN